MASNPFLTAEVSDPSDFPETSKAPGLRTLDTSLRCTICKESFDAPVTLPCGHCFCSMVCAARNPHKIIPTSLAVHSKLHGSQVRMPKLSTRRKRGATETKCCCRGYRVGLGNRKVFTVIWMYRTSLTHSSGRSSFVYVKRRPPMSPLPQRRIQSGNEASNLREPLAEGLSILTVLRVPKARRNPKYQQMTRKTTFKSCHPHRSQVPITSNVHYIQSILGNILTLIY